MAGMRPILRRICRAQGVKWPSVGTLNSTTGRVRKANPTKRVQELVNPGKWILELKGKTPAAMRRVGQLIGVWREVD